MNHFDILEVPVHPVTMSSVFQFIDHRVRSVSSPAYIACANPEKVYQVRSVVCLRRFFEAAHLVIPDGIGIVIAAQLLYGRKLTRVTGADLMQAICAAAPARNYRIFIYGSSRFPTTRRRRSCGSVTLGSTSSASSTVISRREDGRPHLAHQRC